MGCCTKLYKYLRHKLRSIYFWYNTKRCKHPYPKLMEVLEERYEDAHLINVFTGQVHIKEKEFKIQIVKVGCPNCGKVWMETIFYKKREI